MGSFSTRPAFFSLIAFQISERERERDPTWQKLSAVLLLEGQTRQTPVSRGRFEVQPRCTRGGGGGQPLSTLLSTTITKSPCKDQITAFLTSALIWNWRQCLSWTRIRGRTKQHMGILKDNGLNGGGLSRKKANSNNRTYQQHNEYQFGSSQSIVSFSPFFLSSNEQISSWMDNGLRNCTQSLGLKDDLMGNLIPGY